MGAPGDPSGLGIAKEGGAHNGGVDIAKNPDNVEKTVGIGFQTVS